VSRTTRRRSMERLVRHFRHRQGAHAVTLLQAAELVEHSGQESMLSRCLLRNVRMPPEVKHLAAAGRRFHGRGDAPQPLPLEKARRSRRRRNRLDAILTSPRTAPADAPARRPAADSCPPAGRRVQQVCSRSGCGVKPDTLIAAIGGEPHLLADAQVGRRDLIARNTMLASATPRRAATCCAAARSARKASTSPPSSRQ